MARKRPETRLNKISKIYNKPTPFLESKLSWSDGIKTGGADSRRSRFGMDTPLVKYIKFLLRIQRDLIE